MRNQTCQNISTDSFTAPECVFNWNHSLMTCDCLHTVYCTCFPWAVYFQFYHQNRLPLWLTSCSICCRHIRQTDHINCIDSTAALWQLLRRHHIWFPLEYTTSLTHTYMYIQAESKISFDLYYSSWRADESFSLPVRTCISVTCSCVVFLCPFYSVFICPPEERGLTTGWRSMNCCVVLSQRRILFRRPPGG